MGGATFSFYSSLVSDDVAFGATRVDGGGNVTGEALKDATYDGSLGNAGANVGSKVYTDGAGAYSTSNSGEFTTEVTPSQTLQGIDFGASAGIEIGAYESVLVDGSGFTVTTSSDDAATSTGDNNADYLIDLEDGSGLSLREALHWAKITGSGTDAISFDGVTTVNLSSTLIVDSSVTINVNGDTGVTLDRGLNTDANKGAAESVTGRVIAVDDADGASDIDVTFENITITGGYLSSAHGAGIRSVENLSLINCSVTDNAAEFSTGSYGIGIYQEGGSLSIKNSLITNNISGGNTDGGGIYAKSTDLTIINSSVSGNQAKLGGGLFINNSTYALINSACLEKTFLG